MIFEKFLFAVTIPTLKKKNFFSSKNLSFQDEEKSL